MNHPKSQCCGADIEYVVMFTESGRSAGSQRYCVKCYQACDLGEDGKVDARNSGPLCGAIIHVGFEGPTTCAEQKPCQFHDENGRLKRLEPLSDLDAFKIRTTPRMSELEARKSASDKEWNYERQKDRDPEISKPSEPPEWEKEFRDRWQGAGEKSYIHKEVIDEMIEFFSKQLAAEYERGYKMGQQDGWMEADIADPDILTKEARKDERTRIRAIVESLKLDTDGSFEAVIKTLDAEPRVN